MIFLEDFTVEATKLSEEDFIYKNRTIHKNRTI